MKTLSSQKSSFVSNAYRFGTTWGWINNEYIFIFEWTLPLSFYFKFLSEVNDNSDIDIDIHKCNVFDVSSVEMASQTCCVHCHVLFFSCSVVWESGHYAMVEWSLAEWRVCNLHAVHVNWNCVPGPWHCKFYSKLRNEEVKCKNLLVPFEIFF